MLTFCADDSQEMSYFLRKMIKSVVCYIFVKCLKNQSQVQQITFYYFLLLFYIIFINIFFYYFKLFFRENKDVNHPLINKKDHGCLLQFRLALQG